MKKRTSKQVLLRQQNTDLILFGIALPIVMLLFPGIWILYLTSTRQSQLGSNVMWFTVGGLMCVIAFLVIILTIKDIRDNNKCYKQSL